MGNNKTIALAILSWKHQEYLKQTLESINELINQKDLFSEKLILFQEISDEDKKIAEEFNIPYKGLDKNVGIQKGVRTLIESVNSDYVLFLENDCPLIESPEEAICQIKKALELLENGDINIMRLRHRWKTGKQWAIYKFFKYFDCSKFDDNFENYNSIPNYHPILKKIRNFIKRPSAVGNINYGLYCEKHPEKVFPKYISKKDDIFIADSRVINWTNQSILLKRKFFLNLLDYADANPRSRTVNGFQDIEKPLNCRWWRNQGFKIGVGKGLFTHLK